MQPHLGQCKPEHRDIFGAIWMVLIEVVGFDDDGSIQWLNTPNALLDNALPIDLINTGQGYRVRNVAYFLSK